MISRPAVLCIAAGLAAAGCRERVPRVVSSSGPADTAVEAVSVQWPAFEFGRRGTAAEIAAWDDDVDTAGHGLPSGRGTAAAGAQLFAEKCAMCHGRSGEGGMGGLAPVLIGREPREGFPFGRDLKYVKTVGNYWPYATTVYDYINRAMPLTAPGSLTADQIYSVTAFLLASNEIIDSTAVLDRRSLPRVRMPARDRFVPDDRRGGAEVR